MINEPVIVPPRKSLTRNQRAKLFDIRGGVCRRCQTKIKVGEPWIDEHWIPREISGDDSLDNRFVMHVACAKKKTVKDQADIAKVKRVRARHLGIRKRGMTIPGRKFDGTPIPSRAR